MSNIAEGFRDPGRIHLGSIGSLNETQSHLTAAYDREYITKECYGELIQEGTEIRKQIVALITSMVKRGLGVKHMRKQGNWREEVWETYERITGEERPGLFRKKPE